MTTNEILCVLEYRPEKERRAHYENVGETAEKLKRMVHVDS